MKKFNSDLFKKFEDQKILKATAQKINGGKGIADNGQTNVIQDVVLTQAHGDNCF